MSRPATARARLGSEDIEVGDELTPVEIDVTYQRVCLNAAATLDWFPGHHDPGYAREQGQDTIYLSTQFYTGFADRCITDWAGFDAFIHRRCVVMRRAICAGETAIATGRVIGKREEAGVQLVDVTIEVSAGGLPCVTIDVTFKPPERGRLS